MVTPRKKSAPASTNANPAKVSSRPKAAPQKTASDGGKKSAASPAKAATAEISEAATERPKRVVTTASALEAEALRHPPAELSKPDAVVPEGKKEPVAAKGAKAPAKADDPVKAEAAESKPAPEQARKKTTAGPKPASRPKAATTSKKNTVMPTSKAVSEPKVSVSSDKASGAISETPPPLKKASIVTEQEKAAAPAKVTVAAKAETKAKNTQKTAVEVKVAAQPTAAGDVAAFGAVSLEPFTELWKAPEVDTMVAATQNALEGSLTAVNDVLAQVTEKITEQADIFSDAGTQMMARYEELIETQQKSFEGVWQVSSELMEKSGSFGAELASWAQREVDASQADFEALSKVESLSELQELNERILKRYVESGMSEGEKIQKMMFAAFTDGFAAMSKAAGVPLK
jgi:hypothetical protein